jgi:hypothetical protein
MYVRALEVHRVRHGRNIHDGHDTDRWVESFETLLGVICNPRASTGKVFVKPEEDGRQRSRGSDGPPDLNPPPDRRRSPMSVEDLSQLQRFIGSWWGEVDQLVSGRCFFMNLAPSPRVQSSKWIFVRERTPRGQMWPGERLLLFMPERTSHTRRLR